MARVTPRCRNCGEPVPLNFCPACGQSVRERRGPLVSLLRDFATEFLSLDGRHLRTARDLLRPGRLTELQLEGKRASHVSPVRVYFVASLLFFLLVGLPAPDAGSHNVWVNGVLIGRQAVDPGLSNLELGLNASGWLGRQVEPLLSSKWEELQGMPPQELLDRLFVRLEQTVPTALICFVPILATALKLLFMRLPFFYVDHLVFALHLQSALFLTLVAAQVANGLGLASLYPGLLTHLAVLFLIGPIYMLIALRRVYRQSWVRTAIKGGALALLYLLLLKAVIGATFLLVIRAI